LVADDDDPLGPLGVERRKRCLELVALAKRYDLKGNAQSLPTSLGLAKKGCAEAL
jgi:hypothetical protein